MSAQNSDATMAVFLDLENIALGARDAGYPKFAIQKVLERLLVKGHIVVKKAYCDFDRYRDFKRDLHEAAFELIEIPHVRMSGKNSADIRMVVDALDLCYMKGHVDTFAIISGDSDFSPLVSKLRENAKTVIGVGVKNSTSDLFINNCDEFIYYDDLVRVAPPRPRRSSGGSMVAGARAFAATSSAAAAATPTPAATTTPLPEATEVEPAARPAPRRGRSRRTSSAAAAAPTDETPAETTILLPPIPAANEDDQNAAPPPEEPAASRTAATRRRRPSRAKAPAASASKPDVFPEEVLAEAPSSVVSLPPVPAAETNGGPSPEKAFELLSTTLEALGQERGDKAVWGSMIKRAMKRQNPGFNERAYGFRSFSDLLSEGQKRGVLKLTSDEKSGDYTVEAVE